MKSETGSAKFDLTLSLAEGSGGELEGVLEYNTDLFEAESMRRMVGTWELAGRGGGGAAADGSRSCSC